jgi:hypothetical protein
VSPANNPRRTNHSNLQAGTELDSFEIRHLVLKRRRVGVLDWNYYQKNIYDKITYRFMVIGRYLYDSMGSGFPKQQVVYSGLPASRASFAAK